MRHTEIILKEVVGLISSYCFDDSFVKGVVDIFDLLLLHSDNSTLEEC